MPNKNTYEDLKKEFVQFSDDNAKKYLYQPTRPLLDITSESAQALIQEMTDKMPKYSIGLAANQIAVSKQIFIMAYKPSKKLQDYQLNFKPVPFQVHINPKITAVSKTRVAYWHGCLSAINELMGKVATYEWLEYESFNGDGQLMKGRMDGMGAIIFQHEFCHLIGGLYIDCAKRRMDRNELRKLFESRDEKPYQVVDDSVPLLLEGYGIGETIDEYAFRVSNLR